MKKKTLKIIAGITAAAILLGLGWFSNALIGNPISKLLATRTAEKYLAETYSDTDFYIDSLGYSFKEVGYYAHIKSPTSEDSSFTLHLNMTGSLNYDDFEHRVLNRSNTANRLNMAYRELVDTVLESPSFPYTTDISFGDLEFRHDVEANAIAEYPYAIRINELELDKVYDLSDLGADAGHLCLYVDHDTVSAESMAQILLDIKNIFDEAGVRFYAADVVLRYPKVNEDTPRKEGRMEVCAFLYRDIFEDGLVERVQAANDAANAYYAEQDAKK